jgi:hypothetical protein
VTKGLNTLKGGENRWRKSGKKRRTGKRRKNGKRKNGDLTLNILTPLSFSLLLLTVRF